MKNPKSPQGELPYRVKQTAQHIGKISEGALNTLWEEAQEEQRKEMLKEIIEHLGKKYDIHTLSVDKKTFKKTYEKLTR